MPANGFPVGQEMKVSYPQFDVRLRLRSTTQLTFEIKDGPFAREETVEIQVAPLGNGMFAVSWVEESGATVANVQDFDREIVHSFATLPGGEFLRMEGAIEIIRPADRLSDDRPERNKALVLDAMTALLERERLSGHRLTATVGHRGNLVRRAVRNARGRSTIDNTVRQFAPLSNADADRQNATDTDPISDRRRARA